jgi:hypothetical protein
MSAKITAALHQVMTAVGYVQKTGKNAFHNYRYAGEADLLEKLRPAMLEAGLLLLPSVEEFSAIDDNGITTVRIAYTLAHKDGDVWPDKLYAAGAGGDKNKNGVGDKGLYKAITGANKYLLFKLFQIETGDDPESERDAAPSDPFDQIEAEMIRAVQDRSTLVALDKMLATPKWTGDFDALPVDRRARVWAVINTKRDLLKQRIPA